VLKGFDPELAAMLAERYRDLGITILTDAPVTRVERRGDGVAVVTTHGVVEADIAVHGAGRIPDIDGLDLAAAGVEHSRRGVEVTAQLRSVSNPVVWAAGDAAAIGAPLTPVAGAQGEVVAAGILGRHAACDDSATPSVVFSDPPLARVGIDAEQAEADDTLEVRAHDMSGWFTQSRVGNTAAGARLVVDRATGAIKGAHLLGVGANEVINIFALAIRFGITLEDLRTVTWSYPTLAYDINYLTGRY
jgi:glutathione reductase (NADPH)